MANNEDWTDKVIDFAIGVFMVAVICLILLSFLFGFVRSLF